jgi:PAS domain S-box-containing protein
MANVDKRAKILLVEDEELIGLAESRMLAASGYEVELASSGEEAVRRTLGSRFDLVLMDIGLGAGIDGGEAARRIAAAGGPPVAFLSSHGEQEAVEKTKGSGGFGFIVKGSGERVLLASVRMAIDLAAAQRRLGENEERWASLARTAPDYIVSIGRDRAIRSINRLPPGRRSEDFIGVSLADRILPEDWASLDQKIGMVFREGVVMRHVARSADFQGSVRRYEIYMGPSLVGGRVASATAVFRDVTVEAKLAMGESLSREDREAELRTAMISFDYGPLRELFRSFHDLTGVKVAIVTTDDQEYVSSDYTRACGCFHTKAESSLQACVESNAKVKELLAGGGYERGYVDYRCQNGLRDIARPLVIEGLHWATLFLGQFLYDDDEVDEAAAVARARLNNWDVDDYLAALREVPRYPRERIAGLMTFFDSLGSLVTSFAYGALKEQLLSRHAAEVSASAGEIDKRYRLLAENVGDVIWTLDPQTMSFTYISPSIAALRGFSVEEALAERIEDSMTPESLARVMAQMAELGRMIAQGDPAAGDQVVGVYEQPCKDGSTKMVEICTKAVFDGMGNLVEIAGVSRDATARLRAEDELKQALSDKDRLYAELQHRVKNSLALIVSLLSLEAGAIEDEDARAPLDEAQIRVRSIGLLYEQLYKTRSVGDLELGPYLAEVARAVVESPLGSRGLRFDADCDSFRIATDRAVPAGLLLYELTANAVKHAFPSGSGRIRLELKLEGATVRLSLSDDGIGLQPGFDLASGEGLGSLLITQLAAQLGGSVDARAGLGGAGASFTVNFPLEASP